MKKSTSKKAVWLRSLLVLPLVALVLYSFSETKVLEIDKQNQNDTIISNIQKEIEKVNELQLNYVKTNQFTSNARDLNIHINKKGDIKIQTDLVYIKNLNDLRSTTFKDVLFKFNTDLTKVERAKQIRALVLVEPETPEQIIENVNTILEEYGCATINIIGPNFDQNGASKTQLAEYNVLAKKYNAQPINSRIIKKVELENLESIYRIMTSEQKQNSQPFPECPPQPGLNQDGATKEQIAEYNALSKKYSSIDNMRIKKAEMERLEYLYSLMNGAQKSSVEPYPDFPPMPEPPKPPRAMKVVKGEVSSIPAPPIKPNSPRVLKGEVSDIPPPPTPKSPLDHVIEMAKKGANFYYEDEKISSDKAIELLKNNKNLNIDTRSSNSNKPVVRISKAPITIEN